MSDGHGGLARGTVTVMAEWGLLISEVEMNPAHGDDGAEWVELYNPSSTPVSLDGWQISITSGCGTGEETCWQDLPSDASIESWDYYVYTFEGLKLDDTNGWRVALRDPTGVIVSETPAGMDDTADNYMTCQRIPDGSLLDTAWTLRMNTRRAQNE